MPDLARPRLDPDIEPGRYLLYVSRLEPENQADLVIARTARSRATCRCSSSAMRRTPTPTRRSLRELAAADPRVRLTGAIYGEGYRDLQRAALAYVQATSVGGTHPALIEAMGAGNLVLAFGTPENREVLAGTGLLFSDAPELTGQLATVVADPWSRELEGLRRAARERAAVTYSWDAITTQYEALFERLRRR